MRSKKLLELGSRIELYSMYSHFRNVSIALYERSEKDYFQVHSYSAHQGIKECLIYIAKTMCILGGMETVRDNEPCIKFSCGMLHSKACKRVFLEACKNKINNPVSQKPLFVYDKKSDTNIKVSKLGKGTYKIHSDSQEESNLKRVKTITSGLVKLAEMKLFDNNLDKSSFECGYDHDELVGFFLSRALNVRISLREEEALINRGILTAPSSQK